MTTATELIEAPPVARPSFSFATKIFAQCEKEYLKAVRVIGGVANITNMHVLIRRNIGGVIPDGFYNVGLGGVLTQVQHVQNYKGYPDVEPFNPGSKATHLCTLKKEDIEPLIGFIQDIRDLDGTIVIDKSSIYMQQNTNLGRAYNFNMPVPMHLSPYYLEAVLNEMLQYPEVHMLRVLEKSDDHTSLETPVLIGLNWGCCGMISPRRTWGC